MNQTLFHITEDGPKRCVASVKACRYGGAHFDSQEKAQTAYESGMVGSAFATVSKPTANGVIDFSSDSFYGKLPPRSIQIDAMNGVAQALEEDGVTQLVAACGTGKSYMGRQLMRRMMEQEDANGVAVVLTSSIKLAADTASDLRPDEKGRYDQTLGKFGEDYVVIEVHSGSKEFTKNGAVSTEKIEEAWRQAIQDGKKVVLISTYESSPRVQEVQDRLLQDGVEAQADLLMNDEAHNILGQQRSASAKTEGINTGYRSFHNDVPGAIQANRRLYATATPVIQEAVSDDVSAVADKDNEASRVEAMQLQAAKMDTDPKARITVYSDDSAVVGGIGGYISQRTAVEAGSLTRPDYQLRAATVVGDPKLAKDGYANASGVLSATPEPGFAPLSAQTYAAVSSTLNAMAADQDGGSNPVHNALAYCGSIEQAKAFKDSFRPVALAQSGGMSLVDAEKLKDSDDSTLRRQARMRLLAEHAEAKAAYSGEDAESKKARSEAFTMFNGRSLTAEESASGWSPNKRVLANVDIFSEGVSINEIDTVVISDDEKTSERAMTQAIGRAIRVTPGNDFKRTGHVIIPQVMSQEGKELNGGNVALAAYGATRVERGVAIGKLTDGVIRPDETTSINSYDSNGQRIGTVLASNVAKQHNGSADDVIVAHTLERAHKELLKNDPNYKANSAGEQYAKMTSHIAEKAESNKNRDAYWAVAAKNVRNKSTAELHAVRQSNRVLVSALGANDVGALSPELTEKFIARGVLTRKTGQSSGPTAAEKKQFVGSHSRLIATALASMNTKNSHESLHNAVTSGVKVTDVMKAALGRGSSDALDTAEQNLFEAMKDPAVAESVFEFASRKQEKGDQYSVLHDSNRFGTLHDDLDTIATNVHKRDAQSAVAGESPYELNRTMVRKLGDLTSSALSALA